MRGTTNSSALPAGYLAAEFLQSSGKEYIETGVIMNNDVGFQIYANALKSFDGYIGGISNQVMPLRLVPRYSVYFKWGSQYKEWANPTGEFLPFLSSMNYEADRKAFVESVNYRYDSNLNTYNGSNTEIWMFAMNPSTSYSWKGAIYWGKFSIGNELVKDFIPCLSPQGVPCMFDKVSKHPFYNSGTGAFIVGMTLAQARKLSKLPATGGTLTVSLPTGYDSDPAVMAALETARANGWTLTVQTYTESEVMTLDLFDIWVRKTQDENGQYVDSDGTRWCVDWCNCMYTPDGSTERDHGYESHPSVEEACTTWGLTPYVDPEMEELLLESQEQ